MWNHVAVTYDKKGNYSFYINGSVSGRGRNQQSFTWGNMYVGKRPGGGFFEGAIDDVMVFNKALSEAEIQTISKADYPE